MITWHTDGAYSHLGTEWLCFFRRGGSIHPAAGESLIGPEYGSPLAREFPDESPELRSALYRLAYAWCNDPARALTLVQQALERIVRARRCAKEPLRHGWRVYAALYECWLAFLHRRFPDAELETLCLADPSRADRRGEPVDRAERVRQAVATLPVGPRIALTLVDVAGLDYGDAARVLGVREQGVRGRLVVARRLLIERLGDCCCSGDASIGPAPAAG